MLTLELHISPQYDERYISLKNITNLRGVDVVWRDEVKHVVTVGRKRRFWFYAGRLLERPNIFRTPSALAWLRLRLFQTPPTFFHVKPIKSKHSVSHCFNCHDFYYDYWRKWCSRYMAQWPFSTSFLLYCQLRRVPRQWLPNGGNNTWWLSKAAWIAFPYDRSSRARARRRYIRNPLFDITCPTTIVIVKEHAIPAFSFFFSSMNLIEFN